MKHFFILFAAICLQGLSLALAADSLLAEKPIDVGSSGKFDFMTTDISQSRVLAAHRDAKTLEIIDLKTGQPLKAVEVGHAQGIAVDSQGHRYFLGNETEQSVVTVDSQTLKKTGEVKVDGPVDAIAFDDKNGMLYAAKDDGDYLWVIDMKTSKLVSKISIPGSPEVLEYDPVTDHLYLNIKNRNSVIRIDPTTNKVDATWPTAPATSPHGLVIDSKRGRMYTAGGNGKLVAIDLKTGKALSSADIATGVDQIAFDAEKQIIYSACKGFISVTKVTDSGLQADAKLPSPKGAHTLAVDSNTHGVWISYADADHSYVQKFKVAQ